MLLPVAAVLSTLVCATEAMIAGVSAPETIQPGRAVDLKILTGAVARKSVDIAVAFGWSTRDSAVHGDIGNILRYSYLGPYESSLGGLFNISKPVFFPADIPKGEGVISAAIYSLYGDSHTAALTHYNISVNFGIATSSNYKYNN